MDESEKNPLIGSPKSIFTKSKVLKIVLLSAAGICLIAALTVVFTGKSNNQNSASIVATDSHNNNGNTLLKLSPNVNAGGLGQKNILKAEPTEDNETDQQSEGESPKEEPIVRISRQGRVRGAILKSRQNRDYFAFFKVPYAQPPVGKLRFALPKDPRRWRGVRDGTTIGPECIQREKYATEPNITNGSEDCLNVNIYTPKLPEGRRDSSVQMPVMFYVHGGGPHGNGTRYGAKYFMDEDVVLVTVEFRLGMFGGFTTGTQEFPGNIGSRDQIAALKWVQRNIHRFGGDPKKVLLFGNSSGGAHVTAHLLSAMSKGLFQRAIVQSGTSLNPALVVPDPQKVVNDFSKEVGCGGFNSTEETIDCLRSVDERTIALSVGQTLIYGLMAETHEDADEEKFLSGRPFQMFQEGSVVNEVPVIIGVTSNEMFHSLAENEMLLNEDTTDQLNEEIEDRLAVITGIPDDAEHTVANRFIDLYFGDREISNDTRFQLWNINSDRVVHATRLTGMLYANATEQPTYFYWLAKEPAYSYGESTKEQFSPPYGVAHADELQYLFLYDGYPEYPVGSPWYEFSKNLVKTWVSFARDGKPDVRRPDVSVDWEPISLADNGMKWLQLDDEIKYVEPFTKRMELWDDYIDVLYA